MTYKWIYLIAALGRPFFELTLSFVAVESLARVSIEISDVDSWRYYKLNISFLPDTLGLFREDIFQIFSIVWGSRKDPMFFNEFCVYVIFLLWFIVISLITFALTDVVIRDSRELWARRSFYYLFDYAQLLVVGNFLLELSLLECIRLCFILVV